eukprot:6588302-Prymnesium_polylepis.1
MGFLHFPPPIGRSAIRIPWYGLVGARPPRLFLCRKTVFCEVGMVVVACDYHSSYSLFRMMVTGYDHHGNSLYDGRDP